MERRLALTIAGTAAVVLTAASGAVAANLGLLGASSDNGSVGTLDAETVADLATTPPSSLDPVVVTVDEVVEVPVDVPTAASGAPGDPVGAPTAPVARGGDDGAFGGGPTGSRLLDDDRAPATSAAPTTTAAAPTPHADDTPEAEHVEREHEDHEEHEGFEDHEDDDD